jgi:DNA-binding IclR family transcriptional regulator
MSTTLRPATEQIIGAIRGEFNEMPGMKLTREQICRLWHLEPHEAERVIQSLTTSGFLRRDQANRYARAADGGT